MQYNYISVNKKTENDHSILPDIVTGWNPSKQIIQVKQIQLIFANKIVDKLSKTLTSFGIQQVYRVIYMGQRYCSNMKIFKNYAASSKNKIVKQNYLYTDQILYKFNFHHYDEKQKYFPISNAEYRLFTGMNPTAHKTDVKFDADFQCGNLDLVIAVNSFQYDLFMRVDSNTKGHTNWYFFKVQAFTCQKIKLNIVNFSKMDTLYKQGLKPYIYKLSKGHWSQQNIKVTFKPQKYRYMQEQSPVKGCLSFTYQFNENEEVYFAYCIPYSYSYLLHIVQNFKLKYPHLIKVDMKKQSSGGLPIPILTITNFSTNYANKKSHLCIGRLHPGQSQGSWLMQGFLKFLLSPEGHYLRQRTIFTIIPMVNVDGVIIGNFRTGINGKDLNRVFDMQDDDYQEIKIIRQLAQQLKPHVFLDFHGHSSKKNIFLYGPDYKLQDRYYSTSRIFPKLISKKLKAFRYYSCSYTINKNKQSTGRAILLRQYKIPFTYTIQTSVFSYGHLTQQTHFNKKQFIEAGQKIFLGLSQFIRVLLILPKRYQNIETNQNKHNKQLQNNIKLTQNQLQNLKQLSQEQFQLINEVLQNDQLQKFDDNNSINNEQQSDCQDQAQDYTRQQLQQLMNKSSSNEKLKLKKLINKKSNNRFKKKKYSSNKCMQPTYIQNSITLKNDVQSKYLKQNRSEILENKFIKFKSQALILNQQTEQQQNECNYFNKLVYNWNNNSNCSGPKTSLNRINSKLNQFSQQKTRRDELKSQQSFLKVDRIIKRDEPFKIKHSVLPLLGKVSPSPNQEKFINQVLQTQQRKKKNKFRNHINIFYK